MSILSPILEREFRENADLFKPEMRKKQKVFFVIEGEVNQSQESGETPV